MSQENTTVTSPRKVPTHRGRYDLFFSILASASGEWVSIPLSEVRGRGYMKQGTLLAGARYRGLKIKTTMQGDRVYARLIDGALNRVIDCPVPDNSTILVGPPPEDRAPRSRLYDPFFEKLSAALPGEWVSLPLSDVRGSYTGSKQTLIHCNARYPGLRVQTRIREDRILVRLRPEK
jgi:hypothetical protein